MGDYYQELDRSAEPGRSPAAATRPGVLVVDHDPTVRSLLHSALYRAGFAVYLAADGPEALELYQRGRGAIDLVLLELQLEGQDSLEVLAEIKKLNSRVRCCFTASYLGRFLMQELLSSGVLRIFMKPFPLRDVAQQLRQLAAVEAPRGVLAGAG